MTDYRAPTDPYTPSFEATVESVDSHEVVLDRTYFYAEGGGQPPDRGTIAGTEVTDVRKRDGAVVHELADSPAVDPDETVACEVDPGFRTYCMRAHTASHVLYGAGRRLLDDLGYGGFDIAPEKVRVDFTTTTDVDDGTLVELERLANRAVWESRPVTWRTVPSEEALSTEGIAFNTKTEEGIEGDRIRVVTVGDASGRGVVAPEGGAIDGERAGSEGGADPWDVAACGGTHVSNTREIGPVTVLSRSNPGEGMTRVEMSVGPTGIRRRAEEKRALLAAGRAASAPPADLADAVSGLRKTNEDLEARVGALQDRLVETQLRAVREEAIERDGGRWIVGAIEGADANALGEHAKASAGTDADVVALVGADGRTFVAVAAAEGDAEAVVEAVTDEFGGGGGGSAAFAQAGGIDADPGDVVEFVRDDA
jgi:alanyl-tRNA synthetase